MSQQDTDQAMRRFIGALPDHAIFLLDPEGRVATWNAGAEKLKFYQAHEIIGENFDRFYSDQARAAGHPERELALASSMGRYEEEGWRVRRDGSQFWAYVLLVALFDDAGTLTGFGKVVRDITAQKQAAEQQTNMLKLLEVTARTDYLTTLENRRSLDRELVKLMSASRRDGRPLCLAMIDLDHFKRFNDEQGHHAGDVYLKQAALAWRDALRHTDFAARYGGEEFVILSPETELAGAVHLMDRLRRLTPAPLTCSIGVAEAMDDDTPAGLISRADRALFQAKFCGRNAVVSDGVPVSQLPQDMALLRSLWPNPPDPGPIMGQSLATQA